MSAWVGQAFAGTVSIPLDPGNKRPANDLVYRDRPIDEAQAAALLRQGVELWRLNPTESQLWKDSFRGAHSVSGAEPDVDETFQHYPADGATVRFDSYLASTQGIFRSSVDGLEGTSQSPSVRPFTLSVSLSNPAALMRAAILRKIGYQDSAPKLYHSLTVVFADKATRDQFLDNLADRSLTSRKRWIRGELDDRPQVTLQGVVLEPGRINVQTVHWGLMSQVLQQNRRVFRGLIVPDVLCDFLEKVNTFAWDPSHIFNGAINFDYLFSDGFSDVTIDDARWITARLAVLDRTDFAQAVERAGFPSDIAALMTEKLIARRDALVKVMKLAPEFPILPYDPYLTVGNVLRGQLTQDNYQGYPEEFYKKPALPPLRFSQLWRYAAIEGISAGISALLDQANNYFTIESSGTAVSKHSDEVSKGIAKYLFNTGSSPYQQTTGVWAKPLAGANFNASRTVVAGTYLGSDSQVQVVDTMSVSVAAGFYVGWDKFAPVVTPGIGSSVTLTRSYSHVKPVQDMDKALRTNWAKMLTAGFMLHLSKSLNPDIECSIPVGPWTSEFEVDGAKFTKINYDQARPGGKDEALALRAKLIAQGASADRIVLQANDRESDCKANVEKAVDKNLGDFADGLAVGDTFIITDSVQFGVNEKINIPITVLAGMIDVSVSPNANQGYQIQRQTMLRKTATGFQVYLTDSRMDSQSVGLDFNFYATIFQISRERRHGHADIDFYNVVTDGADVTTKQNLIRSIKALLRGNNSEILADHFRPYTLKEDLLARLTKFKFLIWSVINGIQDLKVDIFPPIDPKKTERSRGTFKRTLSMNRMVTQKGKDLFGFMVGIAGNLTGGLVALPGIGTGSDPGNAPGGSSWTGAIATQAETTPGAAWRPITALQQTYRGWQISRNDAFKIFDRIEGVYAPLMKASRSYSRGLFDRTLFSNTSALELYQIDTTMIFYPDTLEMIKGWVMSSDRGASVRWLNYLSGRKSRGWVDKVMKMRARGLPPDTDRQGQLKWFNSVMSYIVNNADMNIFLNRLKPEQYFFVTRVNGFRKGDATGSLEGYLSDTIGHYDSERGLGIFRDISSQYGISLFELYAQFFTDGL